MTNLTGNPVLFVIKITKHKRTQKTNPHKISLCQLEKKHTKKNPPSVIPRTDYKYQPPEAKKLIRKRGQSRPRSILDTSRKTN